MKRDKIPILVVIVVIGFLVAMVRVQLSFKGGGFSRTNNSQEAMLQHLLVRDVIPNLKEIPYDSNTDLVIENAWVEKYFLRENRVFWIKKTLDPNKYLLKISYSFKNKSTGAFFHDSRKRVMLESISSNDNVTIGFGNVVGITIRSNSAKGFSVKIYDGHDKGQSVQFQ